LTPELVSQTRDGEARKLRRRLAGDLDNIILMAMRKEPERRYASVHQLAEDIQRYLNARPVIARKDTLAYRTSRFIRRNKLGVAAVSLIFLFLVGGVVGTAWQAHFARLQRARAERRFNDVRKLANSFMFEIHDAVETISGATRARELLVAKALEYLDSLAQEAGGDLSLKRELAAAYRKVGDVQGNPYHANRGKMADALKSYRKSIALFLEIQQSDPARPDARRDLAEGYGRLAQILPSTGDMAGALEAARKEEALGEETVASLPGDGKCRRQLAASCVRVGECRAAMGDPAGGLSYLRKALDLQTAMAKQEPSPEVRRELSSICGALGNMLMMTGDSSGALENLQRSVVMREELAAQDPLNSKLRRDLSVAHAALGDLLWATNDMNGTLENYRKSLSIREQLLDADRHNEQARRDLAIIYTNLGSTLVYTGDPPGALRYMRKAESLFQDLVAQEPQSAQAAQDLSLCHVNTGDMLAQAHDRAGALEAYRKGFIIVQTLAESDQANATLQYRLASLSSRLGGIFASMATDPGTPADARADHWREARSWYERSLGIWRFLAERGHMQGTPQEKIKEASAAIARCDGALEEKTSPE
jgi:non-specific serine/threonine protein kinase/serine/threonine-protein kinase